MAELARDIVDYKSMSPIEIARRTVPTIEAIKGTSGAKPPLNWLVSHAMKLQSNLSSESTDFLNRFAGELLSGASSRKLTPAIVVKIFQEAHKKTKAKALQQTQNPSANKSTLNVQSIQLLDIVTHELLSRASLDELTPDALTAIFKAARRETKTQALQSTQNSSETQSTLNPQSIGFLDLVTSELMSRRSLDKLTPDDLVEIFKTAHTKMVIGEARHAQATDWALEDINQQKANRCTMAEPSAAAPTKAKSRTWWQIFHK